MSEDKIDMAIMFVDMNDKEWFDRYSEYIKTHEIPIPEINNVEVRSRDYGTLRCLLRSVELYAPWINNIFLVVQSESQVPKWINRENVRVVLHEDIIPKEYLPTYNTFTIQTHIHRIPGISEKFIFSDDDSIFCQPVFKEDFFLNDKLIQPIRILPIEKLSSSSKHSQYFKVNASEVVKEHCGIHDDNYYMDEHGVQAMFKSLNEELYNSLDIKNHVSAFREYNNIFRFSYMTYAWFKRRMIHVTERNKYIDFKGKDINDFRKWLNQAQFHEQISVNDQDLNPIFDKELFYKMVEETLYYLFPNKSKKYEL